MNGSAIHVGATKESIEAARAAIVEILQLPADQKTLRVALDAFIAVCEVKNTSISGCSFVTNPHEDQPHLPL